jgi:type II secretory pathway pseudopilin PulG
LHIAWFVNDFRETVSAVRKEGGFSILEAIVATAITSVAISALAQLVVLSIRANSGAKATTYAVVLAQEKMEQLRGLTWGFDALDLRITDTTTDTAAVPERPGGAGLSPSPAGTTGNGALFENIASYCDFLDRSGTSLGTGTTAPPSTVYIRRWSVEPLPINPNDVVVLQVRVMRNGNGGGDTFVGAARMPEEARLVSVKTRKAS